MSVRLRGILTAQCPDRPGIVAAVAGYLTSVGANIVEAQQHGEGGRFFQRVEFELGPAPREAVEGGFAAVGAAFGMSWTLVFTDRPPRAGVLVSKFDHCLVDLLWRQRSGELCAEIPLVISNHDDVRHEVESHGIPFHHVPVTTTSKHEAEERQIDLLRNAGCDFVVMARYMQVLSPAFLDAFPLQVINVHHGLLPSFVGAKPYDQAFDRGVKIVGATAHFATEELDDGPIIGQEVLPVSHRDTAADMIRKGRDAERVVLARAVRQRAQGRILVSGRRAVVFD